MTARIAVLGAGPAGLFAALAAAERGFDVVVLEAADRVGGMSASVQIAGQRVDLGSHRLHPSTDPQDLTLLSDLLGDDLQTRQRNGRIRLEGRWVGFPLQTGDLLRSLPLGFAVGTARDAVLGTLRRTDDRSFRHRVRSTLGPTVDDRFYEPYARKLYGVDPGALDAELARRRISATGPSAILRRLARVRTPSGRSFLYPRLGYGQITEALADAAVDAGAVLRLEHTVARLDATGRRIEITTDRSAFDADHVISTLPVTTIARIAEPAPTPEVLAAAKRLRTRGMLLVYLQVPRPRFTTYDAHYIPDPALHIARLSEPKNYRTSNSDPDTSTVLCAEIACWPHDELWQLSERRLGEMVRSEIVQLGLPDPEPSSVSVLRLPSVYPVYERATADARSLVEAWSASLDRVTVTGRQGHWVPDNLHHVAKMARAAVAAIDDDGRRDRDRWHRALEQFSEHVVED